MHSIELEAEHNQLEQEAEEARTQESKAQADAIAWQQHVIELQNEKEGLRVWEVRSYFNNSLILGGGDQFVVHIVLTLVYCLEYFPQVCH